MLNPHLLRFGHQPPPAASGEVWSIMLSIHLIPGTPPVGFFVTLLLMSARDDVVYSTEEVLPNQQRRFGNPSQLQPATVFARYSKLFGQWKSDLNMGSSIAILREESNYRFQDCKISWHHSSPVASPHIIQASRNPSNHHSGK